VVTKVAAHIALDLRLDYARRGSEVLVSKSGIQLSKFGMICPTDKKCFAPGPTTALAAAKALSGALLAAFQFWKNVFQLCRLPAWSV
jgi:hypothetical protein